MDVSEYKALLAPKNEHDLQVAICKILDDYKIEYFAVPNGGKRHVGVAKKLKAEGVKAGVADLVILLKGGKTVFVELKMPRNSQQDTQKNFEARLNKLGFKYLIWRSVNDAMEFICTIKPKI